MNRRCLDRDCQCARQQNTVRDPRMTAMCVSIKLDQAEKMYLAVSRRPPVVQTLLPEEGHSRRQLEKPVCQL